MKDKTLICPCCGKEFKKENECVEHYLRCWKELNPNYISKEAPHSENKETRQISNDIANFFNSFKG